MAKKRFPITNTTTRAGTKEDTKLKEHKNYFVSFRFCVPKIFAFFAQIWLVMAYARFSDKLKTGPLRGSLESLGETRCISASIGGKIFSAELHRSRRVSPKNQEKRLEFFSNFREPMSYFVLSAASPYSKAPKSVAEPLQIKPALVPA